MNWSDLIQDILPHVPGCPEPMIEDTIRRVATKFCRETQTWEEQLNDLYVVEGVERYDVDLPEESELLGISHLQQDGRPVNYWPEVNIFGLISFHKAPYIKSGPMEIKVILVPSKDSTGMPDRIGEHYREAIVGGVISTLQVIPRKDWSAPELAAFHRETFNEGLREAKSRKMRGNTDRPMRVAPRPLL
jgi:hypothetical protein